MCDVVFEKTKDRAGTVNRTSVYPDAAVPRALLKRYYKKFCENHDKTSVPEFLFFWCFLVNFAKFVRTPFLQNSTGRLLLIIAVSIVAKGVLANETVNYDTKTNKPHQQSFLT